MSKENKISLIFNGTKVLSKKNKKKFLFFIFLFFISMIIETAGIGMFIPTLSLLTQDDFGLKLNELVTFYDFSSYTNQELIKYSILAMLFIFSIRALFLSLISYLQSNYLANIKAETSNKVFEIYLKENLNFHLENNSAKLIRNMNDISGFTVYIRNFLFLLIELIAFIGIAMLMIIYEPIVSTLSLLVIGILGLIFHAYIQRKSEVWGKQRRDFDGDRLLYLQQGFGAIRDIKMLNKEEYFINKFSYFNKSSAVAEYKNAFTMSLPRYYFEWLTVLGMFLVFYIFLLLNRPVSEFIPTIGLFAAVAIRLIPSIIRISNSLQAIVFTLPVIDNLVSIYKKEKEYNQQHDNKVIDFKNSIELKNLSFTHKNSNYPILSSLNLKIEFGETIGIIGETGAGKSTLINIILGLYKQSDGEILIDGKSLNGNTKSWQKQFGYVPQSVYLIDDTIKANIALGVPSKLINEKKMNETIRKSSLKFLNNNLDFRLDKNLGEFGEKISGGQRQRIGIARALYNDPKIIIFDESTSSLDLSTEKQIIDEINLYKGKKTMIIISHRYSSLINCDKVYELRNKKLNLLEREQHEH